MQLTRKTNVNRNYFSSVIDSLISLDRIDIRRLNLESIDRFTRALSCRSSIALEKLLLLAIDNLINDLHA